MGDTAYPAVGGRISLITRIFVGYIGDDGTTYVRACRPTIINLTRGGITEVVARLVLIASKNFLTMIVWVKVAYMVRIAVS